MTPPTPAPNTPGAATSVAPAESKPDAAIAAEAPKPLPPMHCRVTLPDVKEANGVYIYPDPLVCQPIPMQADTPNGQDKNALLRTGPPRAAISRLMASLGKLDYGNIRGLFAAYSGRILKQQAAISTPPATGKITELMPTPQQPPTQSPAGPTVTTAPQVQPAPPPMTAQAGKVGVQIGSYKTESGAITARKKLEDSSPLLKSRTYNIIKVDLGGKGTYYRLRIEDFSTRSDAKDFCKELEAQGHACILSMNTH